MHMGLSGLSKKLKETNKIKDMKLGGAYWGDRGRTSGGSGGTYDDIYIHGSNSQKYMLQLFFELIDNYVGKHLGCSYPIRHHPFGHL